ncbi:unnamed protein product [Victoria cruziana]
MSAWESFFIIIGRPALAVFFVFSLIVLGWVGAWKLILVHIPLVREICGLKKKPPQPKPVTGRLSRYYSALRDRRTGTS